MNEHRKDFRSSYHEDEQLAEAPRLLRLQVAQLMRQIPLNLAVNAVALVALALMPLQELQRAGLALLALIYLWLFSLWWQHRQAPKQALQAQLPWRMGAVLALAGVLYALQAEALMQQLHEPGRLVLVGVAAAFLAGGAWALCGLAQTGLGWSLGNGLTMAISLYSSGHVLLGGLTLLFTAVLCSHVLEGERQARERVAQQLRLERQHQLLDVALRDFEADASDWLWELDGEGRLRHVSVHLAKAIGRPRVSLYGKAFVDLLFEGSQPAGASAAIADLAHRLRSPARPIHDLLLPLQWQGKRRWWQLRAKPMLDDEGELQGWRGVAADVTALQLRDEALRRLANVDTLTGLASRHQFQAALAQHWAGERLVQPCALMLIDLDNFKAVNDSLGHAAGDELLHGVAQRLQAVLAAPNLLARLGGDEFALLLPGEHDLPALQALAEQLRAALHEPFLVQQRRLYMHMSLGAARAPSDASSPSALMQSADLALYAAKAAGRDQLACFEPHLQAAAQQRLSLSAELRQAVASGDGLYIDYQPKYAMSTGQLVGVEALVRWQHWQRGGLSPSSFIPLAEETGLIVPLGEWVLERACSDAAGWPQALTLAVNLSPVQIERIDAGALIERVLERSGLAPWRLEIEITESVFIGDSGRAEALLAHLKRLGVRVALDDFGTGYSSLGALQNLPLDTLKIDRSFVLQLGPDNPRATAIVRTVVQLARAIGAQTVAEGIETEMQLQALRLLGCDIGQGYHLSRPLAPEQLRPLLFAPLPPSWNTSQTPAATAAVAA